MQSASFDGTFLGASLTFASQEAQAQRTAELLGEGMLVVRVAPLPSAMRGRLADHLDEQIERELGARGAPSPYLAAWSERDALPTGAAARLADQLFRARTLGARGLALALSSLAGGGAPLHPDDSATLRFLAEASTASDLVVLLDDGDLTLPAFPSPVPLSVLLTGPAAPPLAADAATVGNATTSTTVTPTPTPTPTPTQIEIEVDVEITEPLEPHKTETARRAVTAGVPVAGPGDGWRAAALALGAARGPLPLAAFERLFVESYVPLASAIARGLDDPRALRAYDEFRRSFERAYESAFATFGATNRRPRLVMDAHDLASRQARLHNARAAHVLLVDSMRFDLGLLVRDALAARTSGVASLTHESILFAALPTTTLRQLETLARGVDALRAPAAESAAESLRGRSAETVRRLRVGSREVYKLDAVPAALEACDDVEGTFAEREVEIARAVADGLARHVDNLLRGGQRTLLLVVGDHGFTVDRRGRVSTGGASPEEVMVPAHAWVIGDLH